MWDEVRIQKISGARHGIIDRPGLLAEGVTDHEIQRRVATGRLTEMHPGVYYTDAVTPTWRTAVLAAVSAAGQNAVVSHRTAAVLWEMDGVYGRMIEVTVPYGLGPDPSGAIVHRTRKKLPSQPLGAIPLTSPELTLLHLAGVLPARTLEKAMASALRLSIATPDSIDQAIAILGGRGVKGTRRMRQVLRIVADDVSGSIAEVNLGQLIRSAPVPSPVPQLLVPFADRPNAYPDFAWPDLMRIIEADGLGAHSGHDNFENDLQRQNALMEAGWEIRRFTAREIRREPERVIREITEFVNRPFCADSSRVTRH